MNFEGTKNVFEACSIHQQKVVLASTSEVYGKNPKPHFSESDELILGPTSTGRWSYACAKALNEFLAFAYAKEHGLRFVILRYFNTIGPRQLPDYGMVVPRFFKQAFINEPLTIFGDGAQTRSFIHVTDTVEATLRLAAENAAENHIVNVGSHQSIAIRDLAQKIIALTGSSSSIKCINPQQLYDSDFEDMNSRIPHLEKLEKLTGFSSCHTLDQALHDYFLWAHPETQNRRAEDG